MRLNGGGVLRLKATKSAAVLHGIQRAGAGVRTEASGVPCVDDNWQMHSTGAGDPATSRNLISLRQEELVEEMTMYRLNATTFSQPPEDMQQRVKCGMCSNRIP